MRQLKSTNKSISSVRFLNRKLWNLTAYPENNGLGGKSVKDFHFVERLNYGVVDQKNNSIIPNENFLVSVGDGRMFDFVADSYSLMRLNCLAGFQNGNVLKDGIFVDSLNPILSYSNPKLKYGRYLDNIFQFYNETHIPNTIGNNNITQYADYVNHFFNFFLNQNQTDILTMSKWNTTNRSSLLDTGLAFSYMNIPYDADQRKLDEIIDTQQFEFLKNLTLNHGFSINHNNPNILVYDLSSPAGSSIRYNYGLYTLELIFENRFVKTYTIDTELLFNKIILYYNKYVESFTLSRKPVVKCGKTTSEYRILEKYFGDPNPFGADFEVEQYCKVRNKEEGSPYSSQKMKNVIKKAKYLQKKLDKESAMSYINDMFRDQLWNKYNGFHDLKAKLEGKTTTISQRQRGGSPRAGGSSY